MTEQALPRRLSTAGKTAFIEETRPDGDVWNLEVRGGPFLVFVPTTVESRVFRVRAPTESESEFCDAVAVPSLNT